MQRLLKSPFFLGFSTFVLQLLLVLSLCPEPTWVESWLNLAMHWDSEWYRAIAQYGYININGPTHCGLHNANVVFFPGYPYLARFLVLTFHLDVSVALLVVSQGAALGFWWYLYHLLRYLPYNKQLYTVCLIFVFPTSWFMVMAYSESLFILSCCLMLGSAMDYHWLRSTLSGLVMTATRLIGLPVVAAPILARGILSFSLHTQPMVWMKHILQYPAIWITLSALGCLSFFMYCAYAFHSWHLYFDMERIHWSGTADLGFLFERPTWVPPPWGFGLDKAPALPNGWSQWLSWSGFRLAAYTFSEILVPIFMWLAVILMLWLYKKARPIDARSFTWFIAGLLILLFTCLSLATRHYESMSRCLLPVWIVWVISDTLNPKGVLALYRSYCTQFIAIGTMIVSAGFWLELLNRFFLGWWVA